MSTDIDTLIDAYSDQRLSDTEYETLRRSIASDDAAVRTFVVRMYLESLIVDRMAPTLNISSVNTVELVPVDNPADRQIYRARSIRRLYFALAAVLTVAITIWFLLSVTEQRIRNAETSTQWSPVATLTNTENAQFAGETPQLGSALQPGVVHLQSGNAQIMFNSTAVVDLTGPCEFVMTGSNRGRLTAGRLEAYVPERAHGFTVDLPGGTRVTDLGTRFDINLETGRIDVHEGMIQITGVNLSGELKLHQGQSLVMGSEWMLLTPAPLVNGGFEAYQNVPDAPQIKLSSLEPSTWILTQPQSPVQLRREAAGLKPHAGRFMAGFYDTDDSRRITIRGGIQRVVDTQPGRTYELQFHLARQNAAAAPIMQVDVFGSATPSSLSAAGDLAHQTFVVDSPPNRWDPKRTVRFTARSSAATLRFTEAADSPTSKVDLFLDDVTLALRQPASASMTQSNKPTPEPSQTQKE